MMKHFRGLSKAQEEVFGQISIGQTPFWHEKTLKILLDKGLIVRAADMLVYGKGNSPLDRIPVRVKQYMVPLDIHYEWCKWCSENVSDKELESN